MNRAQTITAEAAQALFPPGTPSPTARVALTAPVAQAPALKLTLRFAPRDRRLGKRALSALKVLARHPVGLTVREIGHAVRDGDLTLLYATVGNLQSQGYCMCLHDRRPARWQITGAGMAKLGL